MITLKRFMKKLLLLFSTLFIICSCSLDSDPPEYAVEFIPVVEFDVPEFVSSGGAYEVKVRFMKPNGCYLFDRFHTEPDGEAVIVAVQAYVRQDAECSRDVTPQVLEEQSFTLVCNENYKNPVYILKFYTGLDDEGNKTYNVVEIPLK